MNEIARRERAPTAEEWEAFLKPLVPVVRGAPTGPEFAAKCAAIAYALDEITVGHMTRSRQRELMKRCEFFPTPAEVNRVLTGAHDEPRQVPAGSGVTSSHWEMFFSRRLGEGADSEHLLSMARTYVDPAELPGLMQRLFPRAWRREQDRRAEVGRDKGNAVAAALAASLKAPTPPRATTPPPEAPKPSTPRESHLPTASFKAWQERVG